MKKVNNEVDESHPIRDVGKIDVAVTTNRGARYGLVVNQPLHGDERSQRRLLNKLEAYIADFYSPKFVNRFGNPESSSCQITVALHPDSDVAIFDLLERCRPWVEDNHISYEVRTDVFDLVWH